VSARTARAVATARFSTPELHEDLLQVLVHGAGADVENLADFLVRLTAAQSAQHLRFPRCERQSLLQHHLVRASAEVGDFEEPLIEAGRTKIAKLEAPSGDFDFDRGGRCRAVPKLPQSLGELSEDLIQRHLAV